MVHEITVNRPKIMSEENQTIRLGQFLKWVGAVPTGGQAKLVIQGGQVKVNGLLETRRGRQLVSGDLVTFQGKNYEVELERWGYFID